MPGASEMAKCFRELVDVLQVMVQNRVQRGREIVSDCFFFFPTVCRQFSENVDQAVNLRKVLEDRSVPQIC